VQKYNKDFMWAKKSASKKEEEIQIPNATEFLLISIALSN
jgi:hypothetical protein